MNDDKTKKGSKRCRPANRIHIFIVVTLTMISLILIDVYVVHQNYGSRRVGVGVLLAISEACHLLVLKYIISGVGGEVAGNKRGWSIIVWFLFIVIFDIKLYFVHQHIWTTCLPPNQLNPEESLPNFPCNPADAQTALNETARNNKEVKRNIPAHVIECDYSVLSKKLLIVFQSILIPGLYLTLTGADHMADIADMRQLEEMKMRMFWVVVDILDILQLQSSMWAASAHPFSFNSASVIFFYCYIALIILPPVSLAELSKTEGKLEPHKMIFYMFSSILFVNVGTTAIRGLLLFYYQFDSTSTILIAKNIICLGMQITKIIQVHQIKKRVLRVNNRHESGSSNKPPENSKETQLKCDVVSVTEKEVLTNHEDSEISKHHCATVHSERCARSRLFMDEKEHSNASEASCSFLKQDQTPLTKCSLDEQLLKLKQKEALLSESFSFSQTKSDFESYSCKQNPFDKLNKSLRDQTKICKEFQDLILLSLTSESEESSLGASKSNPKPKPVNPFRQGIKSSTLKNEKFIQKKNDPVMNESDYIVTPPSAFNDLNSALSLPTYNIEQDLITQSPQSLQKKMKKRSNVRSIKNPPNKQNSLSLVELEKETGFFHTSRDYKCQCNEKADRLIAFKNEAESLSDLSSIAPPPALALFHRTLSSPDFRFETESNKSTTI